MHAEDPNMEIEAKRAKFWGREPGSKSAACPLIFRLEIQNAKTQTQSHENTNTQKHKYTNTQSHESHAKPGYNSSIDISWGEEYT